MYVTKPGRCQFSRNAEVCRRLHLLVIACNLALTGRTPGVHQKGNNETVKTQDFCENENQNHSDEQPGLLGSSSDTSVTDDTNGETSSHTRQTNRKTGTELDKAGEKGDLLGQAVGDQDRDDETVDTNDTSHDDGNNVLDDQVRAEDTHGGNRHQP